MNEKMISFLSDLADVLEKHEGGLGYTWNDDGVHAELSEGSSVCIGFICEGDTSGIRNIIDLNGAYKATEGE